MSAEIKTIHELLELSLRIPAYQRPYRWTTKNVADLLGDIDTAITEAGKDSDYRYRIGSVILHDNATDGRLDIVDGQQRVLTLLLLALFLNPAADYLLLQSATFANGDTLANVRANYALISEWAGFQSAEWRRKALEAYKGTLEAVVITVDRVEEAFQLFDSQNTRGRSLDPHDLLKAYHLRAMREDPYGMRHVVTRWEEFRSSEVRDLFARYLFPTLSWELKEKARPFTVKEIDTYKGVSDSIGYTYAARARRAAPCFQIGEPFIEGEDFFLMAEHYLQLRRDIESELKSGAYRDIQKWMERSSPSTGLRYTRSLFMCALMAYYDRFHNFDERVVRKLFTWSFMVRVDMVSLGFDTINKYAIGESNDRFTNVVPMFARIARARSHSDVANIPIRGVRKDPMDRPNIERNELADTLARLSKGVER